MAGFVVRQPNGLLCRFSTVVDCPTNYNMTDEDYIELCKEKSGSRSAGCIGKLYKAVFMVGRLFLPEQYERGRI